MDQVLSLRSSQIHTEPSQLSCEGDVISLLVEAMRKLGLRPHAVSVETQHGRPCPWLLLPLPAAVSGHGGHGGLCSSLRFYKYNLAGWSQYWHNNR